MWFEAGNPKASELAVNRFLAKRPKHAKALVTRGRVRAQLSLGLAAVKDFTRAIELSPHPPPDYYLERGRALASGREEYIDEAFRGLDDGITRLGPLAAIQILAIDLELERKQYDAALNRLEQIERQSKRKEKWLIRRGDILAQASRADESREAFRQALAAIESLPERHRKTKATKELEARVQASFKKGGHGIWRKGGGFNNHPPTHTS